MPEASPNTPSPFRVSGQVAGRELVIETGKYAKQASGSALVRYGGTVVLATAQASDEPIEADFLPLTVEFEERLYAVGKIPGSFLRREGRPGEKAILSARMTDRPIRPLFPKGFRHEVQVILTVLSADQENPPDILGPIAASAALMLSDIPWQGPIASVRVGLLEGQFVLNPTLQELERSGLDLVVAGSREAILMVEAGAQEVDEETLVQALEFAHKEMQVILDLQERLLPLAKPKLAWTPPPSLSEEEKEAFYRLAVERGLSAVLQTASKAERSKGLEAFMKALVEEALPLKEDGTKDEEKRPLLEAAFDEVVRKELRRLVLEEGRRADGRGPRDIRPIWLEVDVLPRAHGSAVFTRGETQVLGTVTLGTGRDEQIIDDLGIDETDPFLVHYNFPPFSTGEVKRLRGVSRREVGHGHLAKRALKAVLPPEEEFPYTIRVVGDVLESNGSSSMATVCAGCLALMDAGVPIRKPVAGVAMGLVWEGDRHVVLTDILGLEDALGDMDFKVAGTRDGVTALQMDNKVGGLPREVLKEALLQAREARLYILDRMAEVLPAPRPDLKPFAPRIIQLKVPVEKVGLVIGPGGKNVRALEELGVEVDIESDGTIRIYSADLEAALKAKRRIEELTMEAKVGEVYEGTVTKITPFGAFVSLFPGTEGLLHISQIAPGRVGRVEDHLKVGDVIKVKVHRIDERGKIDLIRPELEGKIPPRRR
ncbi:polyribonucleotide nucleotidyltransferase [Thermus filiformis]|uniref:Polyribonucleotide nucleotidyltransferase n=1 Tax=Thermus filiformis TaxID=276 RepID=A0A0A2WQ35_THEFI|nr:polyribonucleotide nucleotidyltransferase [Thermus filiformis]KGQ20872.2 polynucleotide phosphorylase/polyadenylase [Thermus filiformis]